ncbi:MAG: hypothetical protein ACD_48C00585G0002 [uncultured bacterium]|nr:MAG: hypothetical protein ACD_48C00585G0002 [uncultured bacterium]
MKSTTRQVIVGCIYKHYHGLHYRIDSIGLNVTGYEKGNNKFPLYVVYTQLEDGKFPAGTVWVREKQDFLGKSKMKDDKEINTFELVEDDNVE